VEKCGKTWSVQRTTCSVHVCISVCVWASVHVLICMWVCVPMNLCASMHVGVCTCICVCVCVQCVHGSICMRVWYVWLCMSACVACARVCIRACISMCMGVYLCAYLVYAGMCICVDVVYTCVYLLCVWCIHTCSCVYVVCTHTHTQVGERVYSVSMCQCACVCVACAHVHLWVDTRVSACEFLCSLSVPCCVLFLNTHLTFQATVFSLPGALDLVSSWRKDRRPDMLYPSQALS
jgi:hypothetical protein